LGSSVETLSPFPKPARSNALASRSTSAFSSAKSSRRLPMASAGWPGR
jgi:hypothetical protein